MAKIELSKSQVKNLIEYFEVEFIENYKDNTDADNIEYLVDMVDVYKKLKAVDEKEREGDSQCK